MATNDNKKNEDFFNLIEQDQRIDDPFASDEIIFKDESGRLKVLRNGVAQDLDETQEDTEVRDEIVQKDLEPAKQEMELAPEDVTSTPDYPTVDIEKEIEHVIKASGIHFNDEEIEKRFRNIVHSSLKGIRKPGQIREVFSSPMSEGGMSFDPPTVEKMMKIIKDHRQHLESKVVSEVKSVNLQSEVDNILGDDKAVVEEKEEEVPAYDINAEPEKSILEKAREAEEALKASQEKEREKEESVKKVEPKPEPVMPQPIVSEAPNKPRIQDIKFEPKLVGPIEEIRTMSLVDFRRLDPDPKQAIEKIIQKIDLLEEESFNKRTQAIKAWKESNLNRLYLDLGDKSLEEGKPISEIITEQQNLGIDTLNNDELEAIIELNQRLRY